MPEWATGLGSEFNDKDTLIAPPPPPPPAILSAFVEGVAVGVTRRGVRTAGDAAADEGPDDVEGRGGLAVDEISGPGCCLESSLLLRERACIVLDRDEWVFKNASESKFPIPLPLLTLVAGDECRDEFWEEVDKVGRIAEEITPPGSDTLDDARGLAGLAKIVPTGVEGDWSNKVEDIDSVTEGDDVVIRLRGFRWTVDKLIVPNEGEGEGVRERDI